MISATTPWRLLAAVTLVAGLLLLAASRAHAVPLTDLFDGGADAAITSGDWLFSDWTLIANDAETDLSQIEVTPLAGPGSSPGLAFVDSGDVLLAQASDDIFDITAPLGGFFDITFQYSVSSLGAAQPICEAVLELVDFALSGTAILTIDETLETADQGEVLAEASLFAFGIPDPVEMQLLDTQGFPPRGGLVVTTNLFAVADLPGDLAQIERFEQRFSGIVVPEPASLGLFVAGLVGLGFLGRRSHKAKHSVIGKKSLKPIRRLLSTAMRAARIIA